MADRYVQNGGGDVSPYTSPANAALSLTSVLAVCINGDTVHCMDAGGIINDTAASIIVDKQITIKSYSENTGKAVIDLASGATGFKFREQNITVQDLELLGTSSRFAMDVGENNSNCSGFTLDSCIIHDAQYGVYLRPATLNYMDDVTIVNNLIYDCHKVGIDFLDSSASYGSDTLIIANNTIFDFNIPAAGAGRGIQVEGVSGLKIINNIIDGNGRANTPGITLASCSSITQNYNNVWDCSADYVGTSKGANSPDADPLFVTSGSDFSLQEASPCKDVGMTSVQDAVIPTVDIVDLSRPQGVGYEIGAYEYEEAVAPTGNALSFGANF